MSEAGPEVLVTGGAGFLGCALVKRLVAAGKSVRVLDDCSRGDSSRLDEVAASIDLVEGDVRDPAVADEAVRGCDRVLHLAAVNGTELFYDDPGRVLEVAVRGTLNTMDAAKAHGCSRYLLASSSEVYNHPSRVPTDETERLLIPDPRNPRFSYSGGKILGELLALHYLQPGGVDAVIVRPHNVYGPDMGWEHVIPQFAVRLAELREAGGPEPLPFRIQGDGSDTRAFCFIDDAVDAILLALERGEPGGIYHVGVDEETSIAHLAGLLASIAGVRIELQPGPSPPGAPRRRCPDISRLRDLGYSPTVPLEEGLRRCWESVLASLSPRR